MNGMIELFKLRYTVAKHSLKWLFSREASFIRKKARVKDHGTQPSVLLFSTHKCASTFLNSLLKDLSSRDNRVHVDLETYLAARPEEWERYRTDKAFSSELLKRKGYYFGVFRNAFSYLPEGTGQKIILVLRDPRDVLTSQYYSIAYSHPVLTKKFLNKRMRALSIGIDQHALEMTERFVKTYSEYVPDYLKRKDVLFLRYEELIGNFPEVLSTLLDFIEHPAKEETLEYWKRNDPFRKQEENIHRHKRKMQPGDHLEKLQKSTVEELTHRFSGILEALGYK
jgi:hypothetical protein